MFLHLKSVMCRKVYAYCHMLACGKLVYKFIQLDIQKCHNKKKMPLKQYQIYKINTHSAHMHNRSLSWFVTGTSIQNGGVKLVLWTQTFPLSEMMWRCKLKCFPTCQPSHVIGWAVSCIEHRIIILIFIYDIFNLRDIEEGS